MMRTTFTQLLLLISCGSLSVNSVSAQELDLLRTEARSTDVSSNNEESRQRRHRGDCDDDYGDQLEDPLESLFGWALFQTVAAPYRLPRLLIDDVDFSRGFFADAPYFEFEDAATAQLVSYHGLLTEGFAGGEMDSAWMLRTRIEYADDFDALSKIGGRVLLDSSIRFGLDTEFNHFREDFRMGSDDELWVGDVNVVYRFAQSDRLQLRSGIGANWLSDHVDTDWGFNFTYGGDWFPRRPWVISTELDLGKLGEASLFHGRVTGGILWRNTEVYVGYDHLSVGEADIDSLVTGLRFWF